jgi:hypothetical protein
VEGRVADEFQFSRIFRTASSEQYTVRRGDFDVARLDLHIGAMVVHASLIVTSDEVNDEDIGTLNELIDEQLVLTSDSEREDFIMTVYRGVQTDAFSDATFDDEPGPERNGH